LFVHGDHDEFGNIGKLRELVARIQPNAQVALRIIAGARHFFDDQLSELKTAITDWMLQTMK
jgi:alpha/beta superfamily hydrolase